MQQPISSEESSRRRYDVFISHASNDKQDVAIPLSTELEKRGLSVWLDCNRIRLGDRLRRQIDSGLSQSKFVVVILSEAFFSKKWANWELDGVVAREETEGKVILPVWHNISASEVVRHSPLLAGKLAVSTSEGLVPVVDAIVAAINPASNDVEIARQSITLTALVSPDEMMTELLRSYSPHQRKQLHARVTALLEKYPSSREAALLSEVLRQVESLPPANSLWAKLRRLRSRVKSWHLAEIVVVVLLVVFFPFNEFINLQLRPLIEIHGITTDIAIKKQTEGNAANSELSHPKLKVSLVRMSRSLAGVKQEYNVFIRNPSDTDVSIVAIEYGVRFNTNYLMVYESYNIGNESGPVQLSVLIPLEFQCDKAYAEWQRRRFDLEQPLELKKNALRGVKFRFLSKETCTHEISDGTFDLYAIDEDGRRLKILDSDDVAYPSGPPDNLPTR